MISSGELGQFGAASQWFFNWIPDESVISMQPEGATDKCPSCVSKGTFELNSFDDPELNPSGVLIVVHIPIAAFKDEWDRIIIFSYWLSYRGVSYEGAAGTGISAHLLWFILEDDTESGSTFDSMSFDAFGNTDTTMDSFILPESCYVLSPTSFLKDRYDVSIVAEVQPVVCVDSIVSGEKATINVSFLDELDPPPTQVNTTKKQLSCSELKNEMTLNLDLNNPTLIDVSDIGEDDRMHLSVCAGGDDTEVDVYFYDSYPYSFLSYDSYPEYTSLKSMSSSSAQCCEAGSIISATGAKVVKITTNLEGHYLSLREMEIYDVSGTNITSNACCYSKNHSWRNGGTECVNDGDITDSACHHFGVEYSFCVFESPVDIKSIKVYPGYEGWWRLQDITIQIFADIVGLKTYLTIKQDIISFVGSLASFDMSFGWEDLRYIDIGIDYIKPKIEQVTLNESYSCPNNVPNVFYKSDYGATLILISSDQNSSNAEITMQCAPPSPTAKPTTNAPTAKPTNPPTAKPLAKPTNAPTNKPTKKRRTKKKKNPEKNKSKKKKSKKKLKKKRKSLKL